MTNQTLLDPDLTRCHSRLIGCHFTELLQRGGHHWVEPAKAFDEIPEVKDASKLCLQCKTTDGYDKDGTTVFNPINGCLVL